MRALNAELSKLFSLPGIWLALLLGILIPPFVAVLDSMAERADIIAGVSTRLPEMGYSALALGVQGVMILGVLAVSSEYLAESSESGGGQQIATSLMAVPSRLHLLLAKAGAVTIVSLLFAALASLTALSATYIVLGAYMPAFEISKWIGAVCYLVFTALLAFGLTILTRSGIIPLVVLIINSAVVSVSFLLTKVTKLAFYLPDLAGLDMFLSVSGGLHKPFIGGLIMFAWVFVLLIVAAIVFCRRDVAS